MITNKVYIIVPRLPPSIDGLGDYGLKLATELKHIYGLESVFIVADPNWEKSEKIPFEAFKLDNRHSSNLLSLLPDEDGSKVLLHYVGYGYAKRGCPFWLVQALKDWKESGNKK